MADVLLSQIDAITAQLRDGVVLSIVPSTLKVAVIAIHIERTQGIDRAVQPKLPILVIAGNLPDAILSAQVIHDTNQEQRTAVLPIVIETLDPLILVDSVDERQIAGGAKPAQHGVCQNVEVHQGVIVMNRHTGMSSTLKRKLFPVVFENVLDADIQRISKVVQG